MFLHRESQELGEMFQQYAEFAFQEFGALAHTWVTLNNMDSIQPEDAPLSLQNILTLNMNIYQLYHQRFSNAGKEDQLGVCMLMCTFILEIYLLLRMITLWLLYNLIACSKPFIPYLIMIRCILSGKRWDLKKCIMHVFYLTVSWFLLEAQLLLKLLRNPFKACLLLIKYPSRRDINNTRTLSVKLLNKSSTISNVRINTCASSNYPINCIICLVMSPPAYFLYVFRLMLPPYFTSYLHCFYMLLPFP